MPIQTPPRYCFLFYATFLVEVSLGVELYNTLMKLEHVFENIDKALDYILTEESYALSNSKDRISPPEEICMDKEKGVIRKVKTDSLESKFTGYFNNAGSEKFIMTRLASGRYALKPNLRFRKYLFRGQNKYYERCIPSLFRNPNQARFLSEAVLYQEMVLLMLSHPLVQLFDLGFELCGQHYRFEMNVYGLCQHYYNKTVFADLTSDPNVAAFFATCKYNPDTDSYTPIIDNSTEGVLYYYDIDIHEDFKLHGTLNSFPISTIGLQVFPRSERQKGFLVYIPKDKDFHSSPKLTAISFKHNAELSQKYYDMFDGGKQLFPDDILVQHWKRENKDKKRISEATLIMNELDNPNEDQAKNRAQLITDGFIIEDYKPCFTEEELDTYYAGMPNEWSRICDCIYIPGDKDNKLKDALRKLTDDSRYSWAFKKGIPHIINYDEGYLLKMYKDCYV